LLQRLRMSKSVLSSGVRLAPTFHFTLALGEGYAWIDGKRVQFPMMGATKSDFQSDPRKSNIPLHKNCWTHRSAMRGRCRMAHITVGWCSNHHAMWRF
jgi:hypothetical protein